MLEVGGLWVQNESVPASLRKQKLSEMASRRLFGSTSTSTASLRSLVRDIEHGATGSSHEFGASMLLLLRRASSSSSSAADASPIEFSKKRNAFRKSLSEQRKAWSLEVREQREASAREEAHARQERERLQQMHLEKLDSDKRRDREESVAKTERQREEQKAVKAARREENVRREGARQAVLASLRDEKRRQMLEHSKHWVGDEEALDAAIDRAVDGVESLFVSAKVVGDRRR